MANPAVSTAFGDLLSVDFEEIFQAELEHAQLGDMVPTLYTMIPQNGRDHMSWSEVEDFGNWQEFSGSVVYDEIYQGYDVTLTPVEFASGFQIERKLYDDDQYQIMNERPAGLAQAYARTRQEHAARIFNNAFSVDTFFYNHSEGVALCSNSHTNNSGASTATGFDNLATDALSLTAVTANRIAMRKFRTPRGNRFSVMPDELWIPVDLTAEAQEIAESMGNPDNATNAKNVEQGRYTIHEWEYMTDTNNWFMCDSRYRRRFLYWEDRVPVEFAYAEDLDTIIAKYRGYARHGMAYRNWRFIHGNNVS